MPAFWGNIAKTRLCDLQVMPGAGIAWLGGINKFWGGTKSLILRIRGVDQKKVSSRYMRGFSRILGWRQKKALHLKKCANFYEFRGETTKKGSLLQNPQKKQFLLTNSGVITSNLGVSGLELHFSGTEPFYGAQSSLGGTVLVWGVQAVIWEGTAPACPPWVGPAASLQQFIELQLSHFR